MLAETFRDFECRAGFLIVNDHQAVMPEGAAFMFWIPVDQIPSGTRPNDALIVQAEQDSIGHWQPMVVSRPGGAPMIRCRGEGCGHILRADYQPGFLNRPGYYMVTCDNRKCALGHFTFGAREYLTMDLTKYIETGRKRMEREAALTPVYIGGVDPDTTASASLEDDLATTAEVREFMKMIVQQLALLSVEDMEAALNEAGESRAYWDALGPIVDPTRYRDQLYDGTFEHADAQTAIVTHLIEVRKLIGSMNEIALKARTRK